MWGLEDFRFSIFDLGLIPRINPGACTIKKFLVNACTENGENLTLAMQHHAEAIQILDRRSD
jgi:hypothetical protein